MGISGESISPEPPRVSRPRKSQMLGARLGVEVSPGGQITESTEGGFTPAPWLAPWQRRSELLGVATLPTSRL